jgi:hypothetical protein
VRPRTRRKCHGKKPRHAAGARHRGWPQASRPACPRPKLGMLERFGVLLWAGVGMMIIALAALYTLS